LNREGHAPATGVPFSARSLLRILSNPIYVGRVEFRGTTYPGLHEPILDRETFEQASRTLQERGESQALKRGHQSEFLLSGLVRCGRCRRAYVGASAHGRRRRYTYYTCSTRYRYGTASCDGERLPRDLLEEAVLDQVAEVFSNTELISEALAQANREEAGNAEVMERRAAAIRQSVAGAQRALERYFAAFEEGSLSPADCQERIGRLRARIEALEADERALAQNPSHELSEPLTAEEMAGWAIDLRQLLESGSAQQRKGLLRKLIHEIKVMSRQRIEPTYKVPALVRAPGRQVELRGVEPLTSCLPSTRSTN
jgi:site-specific DNA recombinase